MSVRPIPEGSHTITPYLVVDDAARAIEYYKKAFQATELHRMHGPGNSVMHASLKIGDAIFYLADANEEWGARSAKSYGGSPISMHLYVADVDETFKRAIAAGGTEKAPVGDMFWGDRYGKLVDPFGIEWGVATHIQDMTPEEMQKAGERFMAQMSKQ
jgi:PhnB protein